VPFTAPAGITGVFTLSFGNLNLLANATAGSIPLATTDVGAISIGLAGDYNNDGLVNAADYTVWRNGLGTNYSPADYLVWKEHYGNEIGGLGSNFDSQFPAEVPQPSVAMLLVTSLLAHAVSWRGRRAFEPSFCSCERLEWDDGRTVLQYDQIDT
jgi:hypothetical protein